MEHIDVVNEKNEVIGKASYDDIYKKKLLHRIAHIIIFNDKDEMLLQFRSKTKSFCPSTWVSAGSGHISAGETPEQGALRELEEEIGIQPSLTLLSVDPYEKKKGLKKFLMTFKATHNGPFKINKDEVEKVEFFSLEKIKEMMKTPEIFHPELFFLLENHYFKN